MIHINSHVLGVHSNIQIWTPPLLQRILSQYQGELWNIYMEHGQYYGTDICNRTNRGVRKKTPTFHRDWKGSE